MVASPFSCEVKDKDDLSILADHIQKIVTGYNKKGLFDGTILVADSSGVLYKNAFGMADRENNIPLTTESQFYLASVSKQFTATAILLLIQQGKITLDEKIIQYIPDLPEIYSEITLTSLLRIWKNRLLRK